jgi:hypothetical protein
VCRHASASIQKERLASWGRASCDGTLVHAHQPLYTDDLLATEAGVWAMTGVILQRPDQGDRLIPQGAPPFKREPARIARQQSYRLS